MSSECMNELIALRITGLHKVNLSMSKRHHDKKWLQSLESMKNFYRKEAKENDKILKHMLCATLQGPPTVSR